jgi:hypothetical protein
VKDSRDVRMAFNARAVANKMGPLDFRWSKDRSIERRAGAQGQPDQSEDYQKHPSDPAPFLDHKRHAQTSRPVRDYLFSQPLSCCPRGKFECLEG